MVNVTANFDYTANFGPVIGQMELLTRQANVLNNTLQNLDKQAVGVKGTLASAFASDLGKIGGWNAKMIELTDSVDEFGQKLLKQKLTLREYAQEAITAFSKTSNAHKLAVREVSREMSQLVTLGKGADGKQLGMMITPATINLKDLNTQLAVAQKQWSIFNSLVHDGTTHLINFGKNTQWAGRQITVGLTVPLTIYGNTVSKIFREVDAELTRFQKVYGSDLLNATSAATLQMREDVKQLAVEFSKSLGIAAKDTASLAADLAATGLEGQKLLTSIRETTRLAVLGDVSNQDAMKTTLSLTNAFKLSTDELAQSVNFLNSVENQTSLSLQDLTTAIPKAGPVIKALGGDVKDLSLLMVALKEGGISAAEGANAIKSGMASLINPTKKARDVAKQYGIDINAVVQANRGQLMPTIIEFQKQLSTLDEFGKAQVIENVFGKYQFARMSALFDNLNASASQTNAVLKLMGQSNKELAATAYQEMDTLMNSSSKRFQRAIEGIKAQFITIGGSITTAVTPILEGLVNKIQKAIDFFQNLPKPIKSFIKVAAGLTAVAGPIIMMVGIFSNFMGYVAKGAMGVVNLGRRMSGIPVQKFEMLTDTQIMAQKATDQLANSFDHQRTSVERLNQALLIYKKNLADAITLNPAFLNRQVAAETVSGNPPVPKFQRGGRINGYASNSGAWVPGKGSGDKVPALLEPGEYVVNRNAASKYSTQLDSMNYQSAPRFQRGGRVAGYADKTYTDEDYQNALRAWIDPMLSGSAPFNNPNKNVIRPYGEKYIGFFRDIFADKAKGQIGSKELYRAEQIDKNFGNSRNLGGFVQAVLQQIMGKGPTQPILFNYQGEQWHVGTNRFTSFSTKTDTQFLKDRFLPAFAGSGKAKESRERRMAIGELIPYLMHIIAPSISGIDVNKDFKGTTQYGDEGEIIIGPGAKFPITGYGMDLATRLPVIHSIAAGSTKMIGGKEVQLAQRGGRINNFATRSSSFAGAPTVTFDPTTIQSMGGINSQQGISGLDKKSGIFYKQIKHGSWAGTINEGAMLQEAIFSQLLNSGLFGPRVGGLDQAVYNTVVGGKTTQVLGSKFLKGLKTGTALYDAKDNFVKGLSGQAAIEGMLAGAIVGNNDLHPENFGLHKGKVVHLDNTSNLFYDAIGGKRSQSHALNNFDLDETNELAIAGIRAKNKMGKRGEDHVAKYLETVVNNLKTNRYIDAAIANATHGSPELLKKLDTFGSSWSRRPNSKYADVLRTMLSMRAIKLLNDFNVGDEYQDSFISEGEWFDKANNMVLPKDLRLQSHADKSATINLGSSVDPRADFTTVFQRADIPGARNEFALDSAAKFAKEHNLPFRFKFFKSIKGNREFITDAERISLTKRMFPKYASSVDPNIPDRYDRAPDYFKSLGLRRAAVFDSGDFDRGTINHYFNGSGMSASIYGVRVTDKDTFDYSMQDAMQSGDVNTVLSLLPKGLTDKQREAIAKTLIRKGAVKESAAHKWMVTSDVGPLREDPTIIQEIGKQMRRLDPQTLYRSIVLGLNSRGLRALQSGVRGSALADIPAAGGIDFTPQMEQAFVRLGQGTGFREGFPPLSMQEFEALFNGTGQLINPLASYATENNLGRQYGSNTNAWQEYYNLAVSDAFSSGFMEYDPKKHFTPEQLAPTEARGRQQMDVLAPWGVPKPAVIIRDMQSRFSGWKPAEFLKTGENAQYGNEQEVVLGQGPAQLVSVASRIPKRDKPYWTEKPADTTGMTPYQKKKEKEKQQRYKELRQREIDNLMTVGSMLELRYSTSRVQSNAETSMPPAFAEKQKMIEGFMAEAHAEATTGKFAGMPITDVGTRTSGMSGFSSLIPGANGVYEIGGKKYVIKSHSSAESALIEQRATQLTRDIFGLETPVQEFIKFAHPNTGQLMFGVRSSFDPKFGNPTGQIGPQDFFMQALSAIIRGDSDLQPDNLFGNIVGDVGAGYVSDRAAQPRKLSGKKMSAADQAKVNFLMVKGGAKRWFAEATAGIAASMSPEEYAIGFQQAIDLALSHAPAAIAGLGKLSPEEQKMYSVIISDLEAAKGIDWKAIHAHHSSLSPTIKKPANPPTAAALAKKEAEKAELKQALAAGFPEWMLAGRASQTGFSVRSAAEGMGQQSKKLVTTLARMNPPHAGHGVLLDDAFRFAQSTGADFKFSLSSKEGDAKNPFTVAEKYDLFRMMFPQYAQFLEPNDTTSISGKIKEWAAQGYSQVDLFLGSDQVPKFQNFFPISARKAGMKGVVHDVPRAEGALSATALRAAIAAGDPKGILPFLPAGLPPKQQSAIIKKLLGKRTQILESHATKSFNVDPNSIIDKNKKGEKWWDPRYLYGSTPGENRFLNEANQKQIIRDPLLGIIKKFGGKNSAELATMITENRNSFSVPIQKKFASLVEKMYRLGGFNPWLNKEDLMGYMFSTILAPKIRDNPPVSLAKIDPSLKSQWSSGLPNTSVGGERIWATARDKSLFQSMGWGSVKEAKKEISDVIAKYKGSLSINPKYFDNIAMGLGINPQKGPSVLGDAAHSYLQLQSGGRVPGYATRSLLETASWEKKAAAPKAYAGILQGIPDWATKAAEYQAIVQALQDAGISGSDRLAAYYIQDVLAHINPSTTNVDGVYEKVWAAANLMKDSQVYNVFLETINSRKDVGGLLNPQTVARVVGDSGLPHAVVMTELTRIADGVHPNTANGARVMMSLARLFPSRTSPGITTAVAAGLGARLRGNFYDTLGQRALPAGLPTVTVRSYSPLGDSQPTSRSEGSRVTASGMVMPSGVVKQGMILPNIQSINSMAGGTGSNATVKVDGAGNILSNTIDDMVANTITGQPIAVSSRELLAIAPGGGIAGVTSPGDEARGNIVHPVGTALMRGSKFQQIRSASNGLGDTEPGVDRTMRGGSMQKFAANMFLMTGAVQQAMFAIQQFTAETQNGISKLVAGGELLTTGLSMLSQGSGESLISKGKAMQGMKIKLDPKTLQPMTDANGNPVYTKAPSANISKMSSGLGKTIAGIGKAANFLGNPLVQLGLQAAIMGVNKVIEMYQKAMEKARKAGNAAFAEPTESAKLLGVQLKSLTASTEAYGKYAAKQFGAQGKGAYDTMFAETVKKDYGDLIEALKETKTQQEQVNQLTNVYANLIQRGMDPANAKEMTAEIARQGQALGAFNTTKNALTDIKTPADAMKAQVKSLDSQMAILEKRRKESQSFGLKDAGSAVLGSMAMVPGLTLFGRGIMAAGGDALKTKGSDMRADAINSAILGGNKDTWWGHALTGTGLDRNPIAQAIGAKLADEKIKTQIAAQLGATLKAAFAISAENPVAADEAVSAIVANFKNADWKKVNEEVGKIAEEQGFGDLSNIGMFIDNKQFEKLGADGQKLFITALKDGLGPELENMLADGELSDQDKKKLQQMALEAESIMAVKMKVDIEEKQDIENLNKLKDSVQKAFDVAIEAKQAEMAAEDKRHEKAMKNLDNEAERLNEKKRVLQENTDYYLKQLQKEKQAEDYYAQQRQTALGGLSALSKGDIFGFIGAQQQAATQSDQFGRDRDLQNIQDTADAEQKKLDAALRGIDARRKAEDERHQKEVDNINKETELLNKQKASATNAIQKAIDSAQAVIDSGGPGQTEASQKSYAKLVAQAAADKKAAEAIVGNIDQYLPTNLKGDAKKAFDEAQSNTKTTLDAMKADVEDATSYIDTVSGTITAKGKEIFDGVAKAMDIKTTSDEYVNALNSVNQALNGLKLDPVTGYFTAGTGGKRDVGVGDHADGGHIIGPGTGTSDSIPARLSNGEFVVRADAVKQYGVGMLDAINTQKFAAGGIVLDDSTKQKVSFAEKMWGSAFNIIKGGYRKPDKYSGTTHAGGGVFDAYYNNGQSEFPVQAIMSLRKAGFAAWNRTQFGKNNIHVHAVEIGNPKLSASAASQVASYNAGGDGLGGIDKSVHPTILKVPTNIGNISEGFANQLGNYNAQRIGGFAAGGIVAPSAPTYNVPQGQISTPAVAQMAQGGMAGMSNSSADNNAAYNFHFNGAGMDMVMGHVNKVLNGRMNNSSRRVG